ncbi:hypothetical protein TNCV_3737121 [Trichonephila clavipes]|nr:hypothetical protein TNCV_3737121 [Trichonephila clavipes]
MPPAMRCIGVRYATGHKPLLVAENHDNSNRREKMSQTMSVAKCGNSGHRGRVEETSPSLSERNRIRRTYPERPPTAVGNFNLKHWKSRLGGPRIIDTVDTVVSTPDDKRFNSRFGRSSSQFAELRIDIIRKLKKRTRGMYNSGYWLC